MSSRLPNHARVLRYTANALSAARIAAAPILFERIVKSEKPSLGIASAIGILALTDKADGVVGRKANKLEGLTKNERGAWLDQMADKALVHSVMGALCISETRKGNYGLAGAYAANQAIVLTRDIVVTNLRKNASRQHKSTASKRLGQIKTTVQDITMAWATSPFSKIRIGNKPIGEAISVTGFTLSSALSVASGMQLASRLENTPGSEALEVLPESPNTVTLPLPHQGSTQ